MFEWIAVTGRSTSTGLRCLERLLNCVFYSLRSLVRHPPNRAITPTSQRRRCPRGGLILMAGGAGIRDFESVGLQENRGATTPRRDGSARADPRRLRHCSVAHARCLSLTAPAIGCRSYCDLLDPAQPGPEC